MKLKKALAPLLAIPLILSDLTVSIAVKAADSKTYAAAEDNDTGTAQRYFYDQLPDEAKIFYDAMYEMYSQGIMKTGNEDYDLVENGLLTQEQVEAYAGGSGGVLSMFGAARDAFYVDYPDIFYVDFSSLSIRITSGANGYHAYIGSGRRDNYYTEGFTNQKQVESAVAEYEAAADKIAAEAKALTAKEGKNLQTEQVDYVHDYIINHTTYKLEDVCAEENIHLIRTSYGSLVRGEAVCEGYSRAVKSVLDRLNIPCVLVSGVYRHSEDVVELHMWNEVQIDGVWYGLDATMDDPINTKGGTNGVDGYENDEYMLVGDSFMSRHHAPSGIMSESNFEFSYPMLNIESNGVDTVYNHNGLVVRYNKNGEFEDIPSGIFYVSYNGMGVAEAAKQGKYFIVKQTVYYENTDEWQYVDWAYVLPDIYPAIEDSKTEVMLPFPQVQYLEFAITDVAPGPYRENPIYTRYFGDPFMLIADSGVIYNETGNYVAPPYIKSITPSMTGRIYIGEGAYHVTAVYDDTLIKSGDEEPGFTIECTGVTGAEKCKLENFEWDGDKTITFDFTPSEMWADDSVAYTINITGLMGSRSHKVPNSISYVASHRCAVCAYKSQGYDWNVFGQPALLDNSDISTNGWVTSDGEPIDEKLKHRMVLVATSPTHAQTDTMNELIESETNDNILQSKTYNINLTVCKKQVISTGQGVRVSLGFPEGYGPDDEGVTFKVYHFFKNDAGEITGVEEIPCVITKYGLIVTCKSFSPFAVVVVEDENTEAPTEKTIVLSGTDGGVISGADSITALSKGDSITLNIKADEGNIIEAVAVGGKTVKIPDSKEMNLTIGYEDLETDSTIVDAKFAAETVQEKEAERGETAIEPDITSSETVPPVTTAPVTTPVTTAITVKTTAITTKPSVSTAATTVKSDITTTVPVTVTTPAKVTSATKVTTVSNTLSSTTKKTDTTTVPITITTAGVTTLDATDPVTTVPLKTIEVNGEIVIVYCDSDVESITVPKEIDSKTVAEIGNYAFYNCDNLETLTIENPDCRIYDSEYTINENTVIYGLWTSTAHNYAIKYNRKFVSLDGEYDPSKGDLNGNGSVDLYDLIKICQSIAKTVTLTDEENNTADFTDDGVIDLYDAIAAARIIAANSNNENTDTEVQPNYEQTE